jgi:hypothetical protein
MTISTSFTQAQLTALETAYASASLSVGHGDKRVTYRSLAEMERIMNTIRSALGIISTTTAPTVRLVEFRATGNEYE